MQEIKKKDFHSYTHIFILNRYAGNKNFISIIRETLAELAEREHLRYFIFVTKYAGFETEIVKEIQSIFSDEKLRFYSCGGSGTFRNMINGIDDLEHTQVGFIPYGLTNDFIKMFNGKEELFLDIEKVIKGNVLDVDYIQTNKGIMLNTFSFGFDADVITKLDEWKILKLFGDNMPYNVSSLWAVLFAKRHSYIVEYELEGQEPQKYEGNLLECFFGNGCHLGGILNMTDHQNISYNDGLGYFRLIKNKNVFYTLIFMLALIKKKYHLLDKYSINGNCNCIKVRRSDGKNFIVNQDGEAIKCAEWQVNMKQKGLHLLVPFDI